MADDEGSDGEFTDRGIRALLAAILLQAVHDALSDNQGQGLSASRFAQSWLSDPEGGGWVISELGSSMDEKELISQLNQIKDQLPRKKGHFWV